MVKDGGNRESRNVKDITAIVPATGRAARSIRELGSGSLLNTYPEAQQRDHVGLGEGYVAMIEKVRLDDRRRRESTRKSKLETKGDE